MTENKRYYSRDYAEEFYIFDSQTLTEKEFDEKNEFEDYSLFADSLTQQEIVDLLNENELLARENERYKILRAIAHEQMDNRILTIKNFVEECSDDKVKKALKKLLCTEVKQYDMSAKNSPLIDENEQLKQDGLYWAEIAEVRKKQRDYLFDVIDEVLPHSGSTTVYNRMKNIGDVK